MEIGHTFSMRNRRRLLVGLCTLLLTFNLGVMAAPASIDTQWQGRYDDGVQAYRQGNYNHSVGVFQELTREFPKSVEAAYYHAISLAQLKRFHEARQAYQRVINLDASSQAAALAQKGLAQLPQDDLLDGPPVFQQSQSIHNAVPTMPMPATGMPGYGAGYPQHMQSQAQPQANNANGGMDPQALQMMMLMGGMGGNQNGGFNMMMLPMLQQMGGQQQGQTGKSQIPPEVMSQMMMNGMMQNLDLFSGGNNNNR